MIEGEVRILPARVFELSDVSQQEAKLLMTAAASGIKALINSGYMPDFSRFVAHTVIKKAPDVEVKVSNATNFVTAQELEDIVAEVGSISADPEIN